VRPTNTLGPQDCAKKKRAVAERVLLVLKQSANTLEATQMEIVLALLALAVIKAITLLHTLTDWDWSDKIKLEDTEAASASQRVCVTLCGRARIRDPPARVRSPGA
jgi:hypothetical protein